MKIIVSGSTGFIGSKFLELYSLKFDKIIALTHKGEEKTRDNIQYVNVSLSDKKSIIKHSKNCDIFIHLAFDHSYKENIEGIKNIIEACKINDIKRIIHLSTISVYDSNTIGVLYEQSSYSQLGDPYSLEKRRIEKLLNNERNNLEIIVLQPTIVYGLGGNWTKYAFYLSKSSAVDIPHKGNLQCNAIYVDDVVLSIFKSTCLKMITDMSENRMLKFLITNEEKISWDYFIERHKSILTKLELPSGKVFISNSSSKEFSTSFLKNSLFILWFKTPIGRGLDFFIGLLKKIRSYKYKSVNNSLIKYLKTDLGGEKNTPSGMTRKAINSKFSVNAKKAEEILEFKALVSFNKGIIEIENEIKSNL